MKTMKRKTSFYSETLHFPGEDTDFLFIEFSLPLAHLEIIISLPPSLSLSLPLPPSFPFSPSLSSFQHGLRAVDSGGGDTPRRRAAVPQDCAAIVVWLEKFEDHVNFPLETLSSILHSNSSTPSSGFGSHKGSTTTKKTLPAVFIHKLSSGLYQTVTKTPSYR